MAEKQADDGWQVVTSKKRKPSAAKDDLTTAANMSSGSSSKGRVFLHGSSSNDDSVSSASKAKGHSTSSKSKSKSEDPDPSVKSESEGPETGLSEFSSSPSSTTSFQAGTDAFTTTSLPPAVESQGRSLQALQLASSGAISPTKSHGSTESASAGEGYVTAQQTPEPSVAGDTKIFRASSSSPELYELAEEGELSSNQEHEPSEIAKGKQREYLEGTPSTEVSQLKQETPSSPSVTSPDAASLDEAMTKAYQDQTRRIIPQAQSPDPDITHQESRPFSKNVKKKDKRNESESFDSSPGTKEPVQHKNEGISEMSSDEHNLTNLKTVPPQPGSENPDSHPCAELTTISPISNPKLSSPVKTESTDDSRVHLASEQPSHPCTISQESSRNDEVEAIAEDPPESVIDYGGDPLGHIIAKDTIQDLPQLSVTTERGSIYNISSSSKPVKDKDSLTFSSSLGESGPLDIDPTSIITSSSSLEPASLVIEPSATATSSSSATMSTPSNQTASSSAHTAPETKDEETTPKPKFAQLASILGLQDSEATAITQSATVAPSIPRRGKDPVYYYTDIMSDLYVCIVHPFADKLNSD